jgi:ABC-2 type transport system permease protein
VSRAVPSTGRVMLALARAKLARLKRDRTTLVFMFAVPFLLILLIGLTIPAPGESPLSTLGLVAPAPDDAGATASALVRALEEVPLVAWRAYSDEAALAAAVRRGNVVAGVVVPPDLDALAGGEAAAVRFVTDPGRAPPLAARTVVEQAVTSLAAEARTAVVLGDRFGVDPAGVQAALPADVGTQVAARPVGSMGDVRPGGFAYSAPAYLVLFVFINTLVTAWAMPADRVARITARALAAPITPAQLLLGTGAFQLLVGLLQAAVILLVGWGLFGVDWGDGWAIAALIVLFTLAATGAALLLGSVATSAQQVTSIAPPIGIVLGMLGGCMWPLETVGPTLRAIGHATPHAWAVSALADVIGNGAGVADIAGALLALAAFALAFSLLALRVAGRRLTADAR